MSHKIGCTERKPSYFTTSSYILDPNSESKSSMVKMEFVKSNDSERKKKTLFSSKLRILQANNILNSHNRVHVCMRIGYTSVNLLSQRGQDYKERLHSSCSPKSSVFLSSCNSIYH